MGKRTNLNDITVYALICRKQKFGTNMILYNAVEEYDKKINEILDGMPNSCPIRFGEHRDETSDFYFWGLNENKELYAVIKPDADFEKALSWHVYTLPTCVMAAAMQAEAMELIGIKPKTEDNSKTLELVPKTDLKDVVQLAE